MIRVTTVDEITDISFFYKRFFASPTPTLKTFSTFLSLFTLFVGDFSHGTKFVRAEKFRATLFIDYTWLFRF